jgi:hypothetical protein
MGLTSATQLPRVVHQLTQRPFSDTSRETASQQGNTVSNSFFDPRNICNFQDGEITNEGTYLERYPTNIASNSAGFSIIDDAGNDRNFFQNDTSAYSINNLAINKSGDPQFVGSGSGGSNGSASDYVYSNPYYASLLNPIDKNEIKEMITPMYKPITDAKAHMVGNGTNAPSNGDSMAGYHLNNPFAFTSNFGGFTGGALGASSAGSSSDYYSSDPYRTPDMQRMGMVNIGDHMEGGAINWLSFLTAAKDIGTTVSDAYKAAKPVLHAASAAYGAYNTAKHAINTAKQVKKGNVKEAAKSAARTALGAYTVHQNVKPAIDYIKFVRNQNPLEELNKLPLDREQIRTARIERGKQLIAEGNASEGRKEINEAKQMIIPQSAGRANNLVGRRPGSKNPNAGRKKGSKNKKTDNEDEE